jgi:hypothetical protein
MEFHMDDRRGMGLKMEDGTIYNAKNGKVEVSRKDHIRAIENSKSIKDGLLGPPRYSSATLDVETKSCPRCAFVAYAWQDKCPRDGATLERT